MARRTRKNTRKARRNNAPKIDAYQHVTDQIVGMLEAGNLPPWRKSWAGSGLQAPVSVSSGKPYRGINWIVLLMAAEANGFSSPYWLTFKRAKALGGSVRKGERSTRVVAWRVVKWTEESMNADGETEETERTALRAYTRCVFNLCQCDGVELPAELGTDDTDTRNGDDPIEAAEAITAGYLNRDGAPSLSPGKPSYSPMLDRIRMPGFDRFDGAPEYYSTLFHEMAHSTGHESRLDRGFSADTQFGDETYSKEELVAEFAAAFLCAEAGCEMGTLENSAAYIAGWLRALRNDKRLAVNAAQAAQKAADMVLGR